MEQNRVTSQAHKWNRFLSPRDKPYNSDFDGFPLAREDESIFYLNESELSQISDHRSLKCLVILGEPGIGKSTIFRDEYNSQIKDSVSNELFLYKELNGFNSDHLLEKDIFNDPVLTEWKNGEQHLTLFLDSLDEALLNVKVVTQTLIRNLERIPRSRLRLRISCRTRAWLSYFENNLMTLFDDQIKILELIPLTKKDVEKACAGFEIDCDAFIKSVIEKRIVPLSVKPNTLKFLILSYKKNGSLPKTRIELYKLGCELHCKEVNESREASGNAGSLSIQRRMAIASRIAAMMILGNRSAIWNSKQQDLSMSYLSFDEILGDLQQSKEDLIQINEADVLEVLDTGLFASRGINLMGWVHQSYAEFLASYYLKKLDLPLFQLRSLFFDANLADSKIIPPLKETATWLAFQNQDFFDVVMNNDPEVLLDSDLSQCSSDNKRKIIESLRLMMSQGKSLLNLEHDNQYRMKHLKYPEISDHLRSLVISSSNNDEVEFLINLIESCDVKSLCGELNQILSDKTRIFSVRESAIIALKNIGETSDLELLKNFLSDERDINDQLKGYALTALWPNHISIEEVVSYLTEPKKENFSGSYAMFLSYEFVKHLTLEDLPKALVWAKSHVLRTASHRRLSNVIDGIIVKAFSFASYDSVLPGFTDVVLEKLAEHRSITEDRNDNFKENFRHAVELRKRMILYIYEKCSVDVLEKVHVVSRDCLARGIEREWLFGLFDKLVNPMQKKDLIRLIRLTTDLKSGDDLSLVRKYADKDEYCFEEFIWLIGPIELGSKLAEQMKASHREYDEDENDEVENDKDIAGWIGSELDKCFSDFESSTKLDVNRVIHFVGVDMNTGHPEDDVLDVAETEAWSFINESRLDQILDQGKSFLESFDSAVIENFTLNRQNRSAFYGFKLLRLYYKYDQFFLATRQSSFWDKWCSALIAYPTYGDDEKDQTLNALLDMAFTKSPEKFLIMVKRLIDLEMQTPKTNFYSLNRVERFLSHDVIKNFIDRFRVRPLTENYIFLLGFFLKFSSREAVEELKNVFDRQSDQYDVTLASLSAGMLLSKSHFESWNSIYSFINAEPQAGREMFLHDRLDLSSGDKNFYSNFDEKSLGELFEWVAGNFNNEEDDEGISFGPVRRVSYLRNGIMNLLVSRATISSCDQIRYLMNIKPEYSYLNYYLLQAENKLRLDSWNPPSSSELLRMFQINGSQMVRNHAELVNCILIALNEFEKSLHGENPAVNDLWNTEKKRLKPKSENEFSDSVKRFLASYLKNKAITPFREVEIRSSPDGARSDLYVNATTTDKQGRYDNLSVIIEVKGCWHDEVYTAMKEQLAHKYLTNNKTKHGIYLIGSFFCDAWVKEPRKNKSAKNTPSLHSELKKQAQDLRQDGFEISAVVIDARFRLNI